MGLVGFEITVVVAVFDDPVRGVAGWSRGKLEVVFKIWDFGAWGHCSWIVGIEVGAFVFAGFSVEDSDVGVFVGCAGTTQEFL